MNESFTPIDVIEDSDRNRLDSTLRSFNKQDARTTSWRYTGRFCHQKRKVAVILPSVADNW